MMVILLDTHITVIAVGHLQLTHNFALVAPESGLLLDPGDVFLSDLGVREPWIPENGAAKDGKDE